MTTIRKVKPNELAWVVLAWRMNYVVLGNGAGEMVTIDCDDWPTEMPAQLPQWSLTPYVLHPRAVHTFPWYEVPLPPKLNMRDLFAEKPEIPPVMDRERIELHRYSDGLIAGFGPRANLWVVYDMPMKKE